MITKSSDTQKVFLNVYWATSIKPHIKYVTMKHIMKRGN